MPGLEGAKIEIHPLDVGIDPLECVEMRGLIAACVVTLELF